MKYQLWWQWLIGSLSSHGSDGFRRMAPDADSFIVITGRAGHSHVWVFKREYQKQVMRSCVDTVARGDTDLTYEDALDLCTAVRRMYTEAARDSGGG